MSAGSPAGPLAGRATRESVGPGRADLQADSRPRLLGDPPGKDLGHGASAGVPGADEEEPDGRSGGRLAVRPVHGSPEGHIAGDGAGMAPTRRTTGPGSGTVDDGGRFRGRKGTSVQYPELFPRPQCLGRPPGPPRPMRAGSPPGALALVETMGAFNALTTASARG